MAEQNRVVVYGANWCPDCDRVKRFLIERGIDFRYLNIDDEPQATAEMLRLTGGQRVIPVVAIGGTPLVNPDNDALAAKLGLAPGEVQIYDVLIVGGGVTGLSAAIYTTRDRLTTLIIEKALPGGQILTTPRVENYPGFPEPVSGFELSDRLATQAKRFGAELAERTTVTGIRKVGDRFVVTATHDDAPLEYHARTVIVGSGSQYKLLNVPGEREFTGYGVSFCGTCDAPFYRGKRVVAVGGGNTAAEEGLHLLKFAGHMTIVQNQAALTATPFLLEELMKQKDKVDIIYNSTVVEIKGAPGERVTGVVIENLQTGERRDFACDGVFVWIGMVPNSDFLGDIVELDSYRFIYADNCTMATRTAGLFACGDVRSGSQKQLVTAAGEGVIAAIVAGEYLKRQKTGQEMPPPRKGCGIK